MHISIGQYLYPDKDVYIDIHFNYNNIDGQERKHINIGLLHITIWWL